jgi:hypothetical protein
VVFIGEVRIKVLMALRCYPWTRGFHRRSVVKGTHGHDMLPVNPWTRGIQENHIGEVHIRVLMAIRCYPWTREPVVFKKATSAKENGKNASHMFLCSLTTLLTLRVVLSIFGDSVVGSSLLFFDRTGHFLVKGNGEV